MIYLYRYSSTALEKCPQFNCINNKYLYTEIIIMSNVPIIL